MCNLVVFRVIFVIFVIIFFNYVSLYVADIGFKDSSSSYLRFVVRAQIFVHMQEFLIKKIPINPAKQCFTF